MMPGLQGIEFCRRVRAASGNRPVYFILQTMLADRGHVLRASRAGVDAYLAKPIKLSDLKERMAIAVRSLQERRVEYIDAPDVVAQLVRDYAELQRRRLPGRLSQP